MVQRGGQMTNLPGEGSLTQCCTSVLDLVLCPILVNTCNTAVNHWNIVSLVKIKPTQIGTKWDRINLKGENVQQRMVV